MSLRDNPLGELRVPLTWTAGIVFIVVLIASVAILLSDRREAFDTFVTRTLADTTLAAHGPLRQDLRRWLGKARTAGLDEESIEALFLDTFRSEMRAVA